MGEIAEMILEGILCARCGVSLIHEEDQEIPGCPMLCPECFVEVQAEDAEQE